MSVGVVTMANTPIRRIASPITTKVQAVVDERQGARARDHGTALGRYDARNVRAPGAFMHPPARPREGDGRDRLALRAVGARPERAVHAIEGHEAAPGVAHSHADLD